MPDSVSESARCASFHLTIAVLALALMACEQRGDENAPGEMSVGEARALEDASSMLDRSRLPANPLGEEPPDDPATPAPQAPPR